MVTTMSVFRLLGSGHSLSEASNVSHYCKMGYWLLTLNTFGPGCLLKLVVRQTLKAEKVLAEVSLEPVVATRAAVVEDGLAMGRGAACIPGIEAELSVARRCGRRQTVRP